MTNNKIEKKKTRTQLVAERRKVRDDLGSARDVMQAPTVPGLVFRWVNDEQRAGVSRVNTLQKIGWNVYNGHDADVAPPNTVLEPNISEGSGGTMVVGLQSDGNPLRAVLMCIDEDLYKIDQDLKEQARKDKEIELMSQTSGEGSYGDIRIGNI